MDVVLVFCGFFLLTSLLRIEMEYFWTIFSLQITGARKTTEIVQVHENVFRACPIEGGVSPAIAKYSCLIIQNQ